MSPNHYFFDTFAFVIDPITNHSVSITMLSVDGTIEGFAVHSHDAAATNVFASNPGDGTVNAEIESRVLLVEIKPSAIALVNAVSLFFINWLATVGSIYVTVLVTSGRLERNNLVAAGPFSALVAIPTVRSLYASSPPLVSPVGESCGGKFHHFVPDLIHPSRVSSIFRADRRRGFLLYNLTKGFYEAGQPIGCRRYPSALLVKSPQTGDTYMLHFPSSQHGVLVSNQY